MAADTISIFTLAFTILNVILILTFIGAPRCRGHLQRFVRSTETKETKETRTGTCSAATCGAVDPVSDPAYNMREIAKQSILLEEHLTIPAKFCPDCCVKHLLHCHGLAIEALMLACDRVGDYPHIKEAPPLFHTLLERWRAESTANGVPVSEKSRLEIATTLRTFRKELVYSYYIQKQA